MPFSFSPNLSTSVAAGPATSGEGALLSSGTGQVVFGSASPGLTAVASNITTNPIALAVAGVIALGLLIWAMRGRK